MKPLLEPIVREFVVRELIKAVVPCKLKVESEIVLKLSGIVVMPPEPIFAKETPLIEERNTCCDELLTE